MRERARKTKTEREGEREREREKEREKEVREREREKEEREREKTEYVSFCASTCCRQSPTASYQLIFHIVFASWTKGVDCLAMMCH